MRPSVDIKLVTSIEIKRNHRETQCTRERERVQVSREILHISSPNSQHITYPLLLKYCYWNISIIWNCFSYKINWPFSYMISLINTFEYMIADIPSTGGVRNNIHMPLPSTMLILYIHLIPFVLEDVIQANMNSKFYTFAQQKKNLITWAISWNKTWRVEL